MKQILLLSLISVLFLSGCAVSKKTVDTSVVTYKSDSLNYSQLVESSVGVLPVLAGDGFEGFRRVTGEKISNSLTNHFPKCTILSNAGTLKKINEFDLSDEYSEMMTGYAETAILNKNTLTQLGEATQCEFLLYSKVYSDVESQYSRIADVDVKSTVHEVNLSAQLWDTKKADIVWEGIGGGAALAQSGSSYNTIDEIQLAVDGLVKRMGKSVDESGASQSAEELHQEVKSKAAGNYLLYLLALTGILALIYAL